MPYFFQSGRARATSLRTLDVRADDSDARDYIFDPSLALLPERVDHRGAAPILDQGTEGACVGFALATVVNVSLARRRPRGGRPSPASSVSARMLYEMARRYDEWDGESYEGTSPRGAMKGWHKHGVTTAEDWPYRVRHGRRMVPDRQVTPERLREARRRPIGAYYRITDSDVGHLQAAILEGDAVLVSAWIHRGWHEAALERGPAGLRAIRREPGSLGLHAFAIVGYTPDGFIVQNSWGRRWGTGGHALLRYDDWFENRQDAWVARPGPETRDAKGEPKVFVVGFAGTADGGGRAGTVAAGLDLDPDVVARLINTGDRGELSPDGRLATRPEELPAMAELALATPALADGARHIVLYAHGGLRSETGAAKHAEDLWSLARQQRLGAYFFIWESGVIESVTGWLKSDDDAAGPIRFSLQDAWDSIKQGTRAIVREAQRVLGAGLAPVVREVFWGEMKGRSTGASEPRGGAALFVSQLVQAIGRTPQDPYKLHLVGHSAGSIYLALLYQKVLRPLLAGSANATLASIHFMAPAITIQQATATLAGAVPRERFFVYTLSDAAEENDSIQIYPSSLLTYIADHLEDPGGRVPLLGIRKDLRGANVGFVTQIDAGSVKHEDLDDRGHEIETILARIGAGTF